MTSTRKTDALRMSCRKYSNYMGSHLMKRKIRKLIWTSKYDFFFFFVDEWTLKYDG